MSASIEIKLTPEAQQTLRAVQTLPQWILEGIAAAMNKENQLTISHIVQDYLSFPKDGPSVPIGLRVQSGLGRASVRASEAVITGQTVQSAIGTNVVYMIAHETGATIPAHDIVPKTAKALRFRIGDRVLFRKRVHIPEITLPARAPIQHGIEDRLDDYGDSISEEIQKIWEGK